jgi:DeoR family glycerol-3-phosphate regulon repressor
MHAQSASPSADTEREQPTEREEDNPTERQTAILKLVQEHGFVTIDDLARRFEVSTQTIRRDIIRLHELKLLRRFHGGAGRHEAAVRLGRGHRTQPTPTPAKSQLGSVVAALIPDGASIFLDVGTTVEAVARALSGHKNLQIVTPSVTAASILVGTSVGSIIVTGGLIRGPDGSLVGDAAVAAVSRFRLDWAVIGCSGFDDDGTVMDADVLQVEVKQRMLNHSRRAMLVADSSTLHRRAVVNIAPLAAFDILATDQELPAHLAEAARASGCEVKVA